MFTRSAQLLALLALVELVVFVLAAGQVDVLLLILVVVALSALGMAFLFRQTTGLVRRSVENISSAAPGVEREFGDRGLQVLGGVLLVFPGLVTGLFGGLLLLPPVRSALRPIIGARLARVVPADLSAQMADANRIFRRRDVVDVDSVRKDPDGSSPYPSAPPELH